MSGSPVVRGHMLVVMTRIHERIGKLEGLSPSELALVRASLSEAHTKAEQLLGRADALIERAELRLPRLVPDDPGAHQADGVRRGSS